MQPSPKLEPASTIIRLCGGIPQVAEVAGLSRVQVWRWTQPRTKKGTNGLVPSRHQEPLLNWAQRHGIKLMAGHFIRSDQLEGPSCDDAPINDV